MINPEEKGTRYIAVSVCWADVTVSCTQER
jgi:hypothetical protein